MTKKTNRLFIFGIHSYTLSSESKATSSSQLQSNLKKYLCQTTVYFTESLGLEKQQTNKKDILCL